MKAITRRHFLAALGAAGAFAGALGSGQRAGAGGVAASGSRTGAPLRFVAIYTPHGRAHELWQPRDGFDLAFPDSTLAPLERYKDKLIVLDGVDLTAGIAVGTTGHDGPRVILTGSGADGKNASIDQELAVHRGLGGDTPRTSVVLGVGDDQSEIRSSVSYGQGGLPIPKWINPAETYDELFGQALAGTGRAELDRRRREGKSVLDVVRGDLSRLQARAPRAEAAKMTDHAEALRDIEKRLAGMDRRCDPPAPPDRSRFPHLRTYDGGEPYLDAVTDLQIDLLARALACDITRFGTVVLGDLTRTHLFPELPADIHTDVAHQYDARSGKHPGTPASWRALAIQNRYSYAKVARLLQRLDEGGVLDDTIVYVSGDMGDPARHSSRDVPTLIAGGAGGRFKMGRYVDLRGAGDDAGGTPNNRLLVSICQAFGIELQSFGHAADPAIVTGRLDTLHV